MNCNNTGVIMPHSQQQHSIYRPAYHRVPIAPIRQLPFFSTEITPIVVPSMSSPHYIPPPSYYHLPTTFQNSRINHPQPVIHHTLENSTITFDTIEPDFNNDLVKDVFFSPAALVSPVCEMSPSILSTDSSALDEELSFETPLFEEAVFDLGLDLPCSPEKKKPCIILSDITFNMSQPLPTPPTSNHDPLSLKRRRSFDTQSIKKRQHIVSTPPQSPLSIDYFDQLPSNTDSEIEFWSSSSEEEFVPKKQKQRKSHGPTCSVRPTIYQKLTKANIDWCRYCGTTEGVNWRPGPWGKRTLCNKHGCDYKGYGFACKLPRLDLTEFMNESLHDRDRPVLQLFCSGCQQKESSKDNVLVRCEGCPKAYHQKCSPKHIDMNSNTPWFCDETCCENSRHKRIIVELSRKRLPLMKSTTHRN